MLTDNDIKEELSYAYVHAVASRAGFGCDRPSKDRGSVDVVISADGCFPEDAVLQHAVIQVQLKATSQIVNGDPHFAFPLPMKNYDELRARSQATRLLVIFCMPEDAKQWLSVSEETLIARRSAYWCNLTGEPAVENETSRSVRVLHGNIFSPEALKALMTRIARQEEIGYEL
jgi:hypothetical protein